MEAGKGRKQWIFKHSRKDCAGNGRCAGYRGVVVRALCAAGAALAVLDQNEAKLSSLVNELKAAGCQAAAFAVDVSDSEAVEQGR